MPDRTPENDEIPTTAIDELDIIDQAVEKITDADIEARLDRSLAQRNGESLQPTAGWIGEALPDRLAAAAEDLSFHLRLAQAGRRGYRLLDDDCYEAGRRGRRLFDGDVAARGGGLFDGDVAARGGGLFDGDVAARARGLFDNSCWAADRHQAADPLRRMTRSSLSQEKRDGLNSGRAAGTSRPWLQMPWLGLTNRQAPGGGHHSADLWGRSRGLDLGLSSVDAGRAAHRLLDLGVRVLPAVRVQRREVFCCVGSGPAAEDQQVGE